MKRVFTICLHNFVSRRDPDDKPFSSSYSKVQESPGLLLCCCILDVSIEKFKILTLGLVNDYFITCSFTNWDFPQWNAWTKTGLSFWYKWQGFHKTVQIGYEMEDTWHAATKAHSAELTISCLTSTSRIMSLLFY